MNTEQSIQKNTEKEKKEEIKMTQIDYFEIVCKVVSGCPMFRIRFLHNMEIEESGWLHASELTATIMYWRRVELKGSFGIDTILADDARFSLTEE